jgi:hypothetical protein
MMEHEAHWEVRFINWERFSKAVINQRGSDWDIISDAHLLIGGVNFTNTFL